MDLVPLTDGGGKGLLSTGVRPTVRPRPDSDGKYGRVQAVNMVTREVVWTERHRAPVSSGALDTGGGVIFSGSIDRFFRAYDDQTGKLLWETRVSDVPSNAPISYTVNGKQYIAIGVGNGGAQATGSRRWCRKSRTSIVLRRCGCSNCPDRSDLAARIPAT